MLVVVSLLIGTICLIWYKLSKWEKYKHNYYKQRNIKYFNPSLWGAFLNKYSMAEFVQILYQGLPNDS